MINQRKERIIDDGINWKQLLELLANYTKTEEMEWYDIGQKVNPHGLRYGVIRDWSSRWLTAEGYVEDMSSESQRRMTKDKCFHKSTAKAKIRRYSDDCSAAVRQFTRVVMQKITRRLILPRQNC